MSGLISLNVDDVDIDLSVISIGEWRSLFDPAQPDAEELALVARVIGWEVEKLINVRQPDYRNLMVALYARAQNPVSDPNASSASVCISQRGAQSRLK